MGQRANLITVENGEYTIRYDHWCANRLDKILFWGIGYALEYFEAQDKVGEEGWLDDVWAEGGAVIDLDRKHLLWWGGEDIIYDLFLRRVYLKLQIKIWADWSIEWAYRGVVDLAEYVGYSKKKVLTNRENSIELVDLKIPDKKTWVRTLGSIKFANDEVRIFPLFENTKNCLYNGTTLVNQCLDEIGLESLVWADWEEEGQFPQGGFWIDEKNKIIEFWDVKDYPNDLENLKEIWEDWDLIWHQDRYEFQLKKLKNTIILPKIDEAELFKNLREILLLEDKKSGIDSVLDVNEILRNEGKDVKLNPWLFKSHNVKQTLESKIEIWRKNFGE